MNYYIDCITQKYCCFSGRARRKEYWMFVLFNVLAYLVIAIGGAVLAGVTNIRAFATLGEIYNLAVLLPGLGVLFRRLHDIGKSGWWWLIGLVPVVGGIVLIVFCCTDSQPGENQYGPNPKEF
jgi:uncharacterized membrane protein YhaH (DUF805 family)